ncbi:MAG: CehA/McbA family metallohydrolase [Minicystis sp.]
MLRRALPFLPLALAGCTQDLPPPPRPCPEAPATAAPAASPVPVVAPPAVAEGTVTKITAREQVPLTGPRVDAKVGDWMIAQGDRVAVVSAEGRFVDFGAKGGRDELVALDPMVFFGFENAHFELETVEPVSEGRALHVVRRVLEKPLQLHVFITFSGERIRMETAVVATGKLPVPVAITLGERAHWGNFPTWAEGQGLVTRGGSFRTEFVAREAFGVAYAIRPESGKLLARFDAPDSGFFEPATNGETPELIQPDQPTSRRVILLAHAVGSLGRAVTALSGPAAQRIPVPAGLPLEARIDVGRCPAGNKAGSFYARFAPNEGEIPLPAGCFQMRLLAPGHVATPWFATAAAAGRTLMPAGTLRFGVTDKASGKALPVRVLVRGIKGTSDPDWGTDADRGAALNVTYAETGAGERPVPPGKYHVTIDRGFEYTMFEKDIEIAAGKTTEVSAAIDRVVDTKGWISADLHLHAVASPDAPQPNADRVRALVGTGVEVGVATDHNRVTDYKPVIQELKVGAWMASVVGDEITTREPNWGHFNAFPLPAGSEPLPYRALTPKALFAAARAGGTMGPDTVVQVNHPRMGGIGYFEIVRFDRDDIAGWAKRVSVGDLGFDAMEVFNGDHYARMDKVEECLRDWYALLDAGYRFTATGNSDSHRLSFHEAGVPRNLVAVPDDDPARFDEKAFVAAVRKGRVVVSSGPFVRMEANGKGIGETIPAGTATVSIVVEAPPWVDVDKVELVRRGETQATWTGPFAKGTRRFEIKTEVPLQKGDWIVAIARGSKPMSHLHRPGAKPLAFTNPIWVE